MLVPAKPVAEKKKKKSANTFSPKLCLMLKHLAIDYLDQYAKKFGLHIEHYSSEDHFPKVLELIEKVLGDNTKTKAIEISLVFYLLFLRSSSAIFSENTQKVFDELCQRNGIPEDSEWVWFFSLFLLILISYSNL